MNVHLTPELEELVQKKVQSGRYNSASEARGALRLMEQKDELRAIQIKELRSRIDQGLDAGDRSDTTNGEIFLQGLIDDLDNRATKRRAG